MNGTGKSSRTSAAGKKYSMKAVSLRTGLTPHAIRAWERRYKVVSPSRDSNNRRCYDEGDVERLTLLHKATQAGFHIGAIAGYSRDELRELLAEMPGETTTYPTVASSLTVGAMGEVSGSPEDYIERFVLALEKMDVKSLDSLLAVAEIAFGRNVLLDRVIVPLMERVGDMWRRGEIRIAHEHLATQTVRTFLGGILSSQGAYPGAPHALVTTPSNQVHELGALAAAVAASSEGWNVNYLGPNLPAEEIAGVVGQFGSKVVILSLVYPEGDLLVENEIRKLRKHLPGIPFLVGGRARQSYAQVLKETGAIVVDDLYGLRRALEALLR